MIDLDGKKIFVGAVIILAVGYGAHYARYVKKGVCISQSQQLAKELQEECVCHLTNPDPVKSKEFISRAKDALPKLDKADAAVVAHGETNRDKFPSESLSQCLDQVQSKVDKLRDSH